MTDKKGCVVLMDEPDASLHPSWQSYLLPVLRRCASANDFQFILATHSPQVISSARQEELRIPSRDEEGQVRAVECEEGPYGWIEERVLDEIQDLPIRRTPEVENELERLRRAVRERHYETDEFRQAMARLEKLLGYSDRDLILLRLEMIRQKKEQSYVEG